MDKISNHHVEQMDFVKPRLLAITEASFFNNIHNNSCFDAKDVNVNFFACNQNRINDEFQ